MLAVLANATVSSADMASMFPGLAQVSRHVEQVGVELVLVLENRFLDYFKSFQGCGLQASLPKLDH